MFNNDLHKKSVRKKANMCTIAMSSHNKENNDTCF